MGRQATGGLSRNFWLLFSGRAVSYFGTYLAPIAVAFPLAGPILSVVGMRAYLLFGAAWLVASTTFMARVPAIRDFTYDEVPEAVVSTA